MGSRDRLLLRVLLLNCSLRLHAPAITSAVISLILRICISACAARMSREDEGRTQIIFQKGR